MRGMAVSNVQFNEAVELFNNSQDGEFLLVWRVRVSSSGVWVTYGQEFGHQLSGLNNVGIGPLVTGEAAKAGLIFEGNLANPPIPDFWGTNPGNCQDSQGMDIPLAVVKGGYSFVVFDASGAGNPMSVGFIWQVCRPQDFTYLK